jgi:hypothetical protein
LWTSGFDDPDALETETGIWDGIFDAVRPDVVIADTSPALQLASHERVPLVLIGSGFSVPPGHLREFPVVFPQAEERVTAAGVLSVVNEVLGRRGVRRIATLPELWDRPSAISGVREFDHYREHRKEGQHAKPSTLPEGELVPPPDTPRLFAYLSNSHPMLAAIIGGLGRLEVQTEIFCRDLKPELRAYAEGYDVAFHTEAQDLPSLLPKVSLVVHHGGLGTAQLALLNGRPQLILPYQYEQRLNGDLLVGAGGAAKVVHVPDSEFVDAFEGAAEGVLESLVALNGTAIALARTIRARESETSEEQTLAIVRRAIHDGS